MSFANLLFQKCPPKYLGKALSEIIGVDLKHITSFSDITQEDISLIFSSIDSVNIVLSDKFLRDNILMNNEIGLNYLKENLSTIMDMELKRGCKIPLYYRGFKIIGFKQGYTSSGTFYDSADKLRVRASHSSMVADGAVVTSTTIDLTNVSNIKFICQNQGYYDSSNRTYFNASTSQMGQFNLSDESVYYSYDFSCGEISLGVESLNGNYYIRVHALDNSSTAYQTSDVYLYELYLEI